MADRGGVFVSVTGTQGRVLSVWTGVRNGAVRVPETGALGGDTSFGPSCRRIHVPERLVV